nr:Pectinacetylesterase domain protein [Leptospira interrogans serovar Copenhageni/Icterohaemorrhagiae]
MRSVQTTEETVPTLILQKSKINLTLNAATSDQSYVNNTDLATTCRPIVGL